MNSSPAFARSHARSKLCCMMPTGTSVGYPMSSFFKVVIDGTGKLNSPSMGLNRPFEDFSEVTCEK